MPTPMTLVLFGATGDLARSKLWPALHDLAASGRLPEQLSVLGAALEDREGDRLTYLSVAPSLFGEIAGRLAGIGLGREAGPASRLVIEKPFGEDIESARALRAERLKVLRSIRPIEPAAAVLGQYEGPSDEVEAQWAAIEPLLRERLDPAPYAPGSAGPEEAGDIPGRDGRRWRPLE